ncbi:MAG: hypothetical protein ACYDCM_17080 [Candidatus Acidiferrales bacterium]
MKRKWFHYFLKLAVGFVFLLVLMGLYLRFFSGRRQQLVSSPDGAVIAEVRLYRGVSAMDAPEDAVEVRTKFNPFRHTVFFALNYGGDVSISWLNSHHLLVTCINSKNLTVYTKQQKWKDITIHYVNR